MAWSERPRDRRPRGGEYVDEARERLAPVLESLVTSSDGDTVVVVTHSTIGARNNRIRSTETVRSSRGSVSPTR